MNNRNFSSEFEFITSRSSGAGGQNVNKVSSKVELRFDIQNSNLLSEEEKRILNEKLYTKITTNGILRIVSQVERSQVQNKELCIEKFYALLQKCFTPRKKRKPTRPSKSSKEKRLKEKKINSEKKILRGNVIQ